jgi:hypothetical protein
MAHEEICTDEVRRKEIERETRLLREVESNLKEVCLEFRKQSFRL